MGCVLVHYFAFASSLVDQPELEMFKIAQATMHQFGGTTAGTRGKILFFDQGHPQATRCRVERNASSGNAAAYNQQIELYASETFQGFFPAKGGKWFRPMA